jgi:SAM-dependent methyltransferase
MIIDYDHNKNLHTLRGPRCALPIVFPSGFPRSILDVGCGTGTWLRTAIDLGAREVFGIDGVSIPDADLLFDPKFFKVCDLTSHIDLGRKFEVTLCLEVAEHLDERFATTLIDTLIRHSDCVVFSAACPDQPGQHHVNCRWPSYWQRLFNECGYACEDAVRWQLWEEAEVEPWYRQNMFIAKRMPRVAGLEPRIRPALHPEIVKVQLQNPPYLTKHLGCISVKRYPSILARALFSKISRKYQTLRQKA